MVGRQIYILAKNPVNVNAQYFDAFADIGAADPACVALAAGKHVINRNMIAYFYIRYPCAGFNNFAGCFMTQNPWISGKRILTMEYMHI